MGIISTRELLDRYYDSVSGTSITRMRNQIDKPELFDYEEEIGKELIDMNVDELFGLIDALKSKKNGKEINYMVAHASYDHLATMLRAIFNYYTNNIQPIRNPFNDDRMKGIAAIKRLSQGKQPFTWKTVEGFIGNLHRDYDPIRADYVELIVLLYCCGFANAEDIATLKSDMINHHTKTVKFPNKKSRIYLSDRCYELLVKFNSLDFSDENNGNRVLVSWRDSYFKFFVRKKFADTVDNRTLKAVCGSINKYISRDINDRYNVRIGSHLLYCLGFYEYLIGKHGRENIDKMLTSHRDSVAIEEISQLAEEYGFQSPNFYYLKKELQPFVAF